jgi:hypothetical protein
LLYNPKIRVSIDGAIDDTLLRFDRRSDRRLTENVMMLGEAFDPKSAFSIENHIRPHWSQAGAVVFVTFRTNDSIPAEVIHRWHREKRDWLRSKGINCDGDLEAAIISLHETDRNEFHKHFRRSREMFLDTCHGKCLLRCPDLSKTVAASCTLTANVIEWATLLLCQITFIFWLCFLMKSKCESSLTAGFTGPLGK